MLGTRWSPRSYELRDFLARNRVPYQWIDAELSANDPETKQLLEVLGPDAASLPVVLFPDGTKLLEAFPAEVAQRVGLRTRAQTNFYDLAIIGGGPAGLAAAVYGASEGLHTVMIEREAPGGQAGMSSRIENYLGFPTGLSGGDLARRAVVQAQRFGVEILSPQEAVSVRMEGSYRFIKLSDGSEISCHALMVATGVQWRRLDAPGIDRLQGAGVYYGGGATEALSCKGEIVYVIGGANSAGQAAMNFAKYAERVVIVVRGEFALQHHVAIFDRPSQRDTQYPDLAERQRGPRFTAKRIWKKFPSSVPIRTRLSACLRARCLFSSGACREPIGWPVSSSATIAASFSPVPTSYATGNARKDGRSNAIPSCSKRMSPAFLRWATCATVR